ncbi:MAG: hypothetical protein EON95_20615 [Caulobacteraceae bacterium]|nr:hypothetical protein [Caulobacter sp.]RYF88249.1 MAG: hypothetical protein EON95_20615 [Caulobacteraceae bacterium]
MSDATLEAIQPQRHRPWRFVVGALAAWLFPSWTIPLGVLLVSVIANPSPEAVSIRLEYLFVSAVMIPVFGLFIGAPTLTVGYLGWALLHRAGFRSAGAAVLLGLFAPFASIGVISLFSPGPFMGDGGGIFLGGLVLLGGVTGLLVRWIAYPRSADPRQP